MALKKTGVQLVAEGDAAFLATMAQAGKAVTGFGDSSTKASGGVSKLSEVMTGTLRQAGAMALNMFASLGSTALHGIGQAVSAAGDYEQSMNLFQATTGASADAMQQAGQLAKALGGDLTLPATSAASAGTAMNALAKAGLSVEDAMSAAKGTLQLAAAGMIDEGSAATITAAALNQFHLQGTEATHVADLLAASISASGSSVEQTGQAVQQAGSSFAAAHVPLSDFVTLINEMSKAGIKGSDAGTSLKTMLMRLQAPTDKARSAMADLGISVYDSAGAMRPMREIIGQFSKSLTGLTQQQRDQAVVTIFGADAQRAANIVLAGGTAAYDAMSAKVNVSGAAATQAAAQMKGLKGTVQGLQSQVETLSLEALEPLLPIMTSVVAKAAEIAGSFVGSVGPAVTLLIGVVSDAGHVIMTAFVPAVEAAGAALLLYAVTNIPAVIAGLPGLIALVVSSVAAFTAQAAAILLTVGPLVIIAGAIAAVGIAWTKYVNANTNATAALLAGKQFWIDSATVLADYGKASDATRAKLAPLADSIKMQRDMLQDNIQSLAQRKEAGLISEQQFAAEMDQANGLATAIDYASKQLDTQTKAELTTAAAALTATNQAEDMAGAHDDLTGAIQLTEEEIATLGKTIKKAYKDGTSAIDSYVTSAIKFNDELTKAIQDGSEEQQVAVADNYAQQAAAARASIGEQLSTYTIAQMQLGNISKEQAGTILGAIEKEFGTTQSIAASTFLAMEQSIDTFAANGGQSADALGGSLNALAENAITTKEKMDALATKYEAELIENFKEGKIDADELRAALAKIPEKVHSEVTITTEYKTIGHPEQTGGSTVGGNATGGKMRKGETAIVGEKGPELFTAGAAGYVTPNHRMPPASASQIIMPRPQIIVMQPANTTNTTNNTTVNNGRMGRGLAYEHMAALYGGRG